MDGRNSNEKKSSKWCSQCPMTLDYHDGIPMAFPRPRASTTQTIPLPTSHIPRTQSELQLREDMVEAEWRELRMFYRVVNGIQRRQLRGDGVHVTPNESSSEGSPSNMNVGPSLMDEWSIVGFPENDTDRRFKGQEQQYQHVEPRRYIPYPVPPGVPALIAPSAGAPNEETAFYPDEDAAFTLDL